MVNFSHVMNSCTDIHLFLRPPVGGWKKNISSIIKVSGGAVSPGGLGIGAAIVGAIDSAGQFGGGRAVCVGVGGSAVWLASTILAL